jgi:phage protein D
MADKTYQIELGGETVSEDFYGAVLSLAVTESCASAGSLRLRLRIDLDDNGVWRLVEDERFDLFQKIKVSIGFSAGKGLAGALQGMTGGNDKLAPVFDGYITAIAPTFDAQPDYSVLEIHALDTSVLMSLEEKIAGWPDASDSDIARRILDGYGVQAKVESTATTHQESDTTIMQRGSDIQFVRTLAQRNGMEFYFETDANSGDVTAFFRPPQLDGEPQPDLAIQFGDASNLRSFAARLAGQRPLHVKVQQVDVKANSANTAQAGNLGRIKLGANDLSELESSTLEGLANPQDAVAQMLLLGPPTSDATELQTLAQAVRDDAGWCIVAQGEINSDAYQAVLRPRRLVLVKGAGKAYSGKYYVTRVVHEITGDGAYTQNFEAVRNARGLDGSESFGGTGLPVSIPGV